MLLRLKLIEPRASVDRTRGLVDCCALGGYHVVCREVCALWPKSACSNSCTSQVRYRECFTRDVQHGGPWTAVGADLKGLQLCSTSGPGEVLHSRSQPACFARSREQGPIHTLLHILGAPASQLRHFSNSTRNPPSGALRRHTYWPDVSC